ncbi:hypothetical protein N836_34465 [Leptolyngbya sp. Heron Island J]|nr:hypothetical protein N836_34465 [Leptolyngbya sp. Heron Island J]
MAMGRQQSAPGLDAWESTFADGLVANSRVGIPDPWIAGHVHVVRNLPDQPEFTPTGEMPFYQVIYHLTPVYLTERIQGNKPYLNKVLIPGDILITSAEFTAQDRRTTWKSSDGEGTSILSLMLEPTQIKAASQTLDLDYTSTKLIPHTLSSDPVLENLLRALGSELESEASAGRLYAEQLIQTVAVHLVSKYTPRQPALKAHNDKLAANLIRRVEAYVRTHLSEELTLTTLAKQVLLSDYYFARQFKAATGETPAAFVCRLRMERAARILRDRPYFTIAMVATEVGYSDPAAFAKAFRRQMGINPSTYRQTCR